MRGPSAGFGGPQMGGGRGLRTLLGVDEAGAVVDQDGPGRADGHGERYRSTTHVCAHVRRERG